jgi:hypothetical protein
MPRSSHFPWVIVFAIALHYLWGVALIVQPSVSEIAIFAGLDRFISLGISAQALGIILVIAASLATRGLLMPPNRKSLALLMPQYLLMVGALLSDTEALITGHVLGREAAVDRVVLATVLGPIIIAALCHSLAIIERHAFRWKL